MKLSNSAKTVLSIFFLTIATGQCIDNIDEERSRRGRKGKTHRHKARSRSRKGKETDIIYDPELLYD